MNYDQIRDAELNRHLDAKYAPPTLDDLQRDAADQHRAEQRAERERAERIEAARSEIADIQKCLLGGSLDYEAAGGVLIEYSDEIMQALKLAQSDPLAEIIHLRHEIVQLRFAVTLFRAAKHIQAGS